MALFNSHVNVYQRVSVQAAPWQPWPCLIHLHALGGEVLTKAQAQHLTLLPQHRLDETRRKTKGSSPGLSGFWGKTWEKTKDMGKFRSKDPITV